MARCQKKKTFEINGWLRAGRKVGIYIENEWLYHAHDENETSLLFGPMGFHCFSRTPLNLDSEEKIWKAKQRSTFDARVDLSETTAEFVNLDEICKSTS